MGDNLRDLLVAESGFGASLPSRFIARAAHPSMSDQAGPGVLQKPTPYNDTTAAAWGQGTPAVWPRTVGLAWCCGRQRARGCFCRLSGPVPAPFARAVRLCRMAIGRGHGHAAGWRASWGGRPGGESKFAINVLIMATRGPMLRAPC